MNLKELEKLAKLCHKYGIRTYTTPELTLNFDLPTPKQELTPDTKDTPKPEYSEEDALFWSSSNLV